MKKRTVIALGLLAAAMLAFIVVFERGSLSTGEIDGRRGRLLDRFVRARVDKIEIQHAGKMLSLVRERAADEPDELGVWKLLRPLRAEADENTVDSLLSALEWADSRRTISGVGKTDLRRFGLDKPRVRAWFHVAGQRSAVVVGSRAAGGHARNPGVYVMLGDPDTVYVAGLDLVEALSHDADHFRSKRLLPGVAATTATRIRLAGPEGSRELSLDGGRWQLLLRGADAGAASPTAARDILAALDDARAMRFVSESATQLARYGLAEPWRDVVLDLPRAAWADGLRGALSDGGREKQPPETARLRIGAECEGHEGERYALAGNRGPVVCITSGAFEPLAKPDDELRDNRLVRADASEVTRVTISRGSARLEVYKDRDAWKYRAQGGAATDADRTRVENWLDELGQRQARAFLAASDEALRLHGLARPQVTLTIDVEGSERQETVHLGSTSADAASVYARRGEEPVLLELPAEAADLVDVSVERLRAAPRDAGAGKRDAGARGSAADR